MRELEAKPNLRDPIADDRLEDVARLREDPLDHAGEAERRLEAHEDGRVDALGSEESLLTGIGTDTENRGQGAALGVELSCGGDARSQAADVRSITAGVADLPQERDGGIRRGWPSRMSAIGWFREALDVLSIEVEKTRLVGYIDTTAQQGLDNLQPRPVFTAHHGTMQRLSLIHI